MMETLKLYENVFIETNIFSLDYDSVIILLHSNEVNENLPGHIQEFVARILTIDKHAREDATLWNCDYVCGQRLILSPTGKMTPYHNSRSLYDAAKKGLARAFKAGAQKPLLVVHKLPDMIDSQLIAILGAFEVLYQRKFQRIGLHSEEKITDQFEKVVRNAIALERSRTFYRDIIITPSPVDFIKKKFSQHNNVDIDVPDREFINDHFPLFSVYNHEPSVVKLVYQPANTNRISETLVLIGQGCRSASDSYEKTAAATVAGFIKACCILKPQHLKVKGILYFGISPKRNETLKRGKTAVTLRDADIMAEFLNFYKTHAKHEINTHFYSVGALSESGYMYFGNSTVVTDNFGAKATKHDSRMEFCSSKMAEFVESSTIKWNDFTNECRSDPVRSHQKIVVRLIESGGMENLKYSHLDVTGSSRDMTGTVVLTLSHLHKLFV